MYRAGIVVGREGIVCQLYGLAGAGESSGSCFTVVDRPPWMLDSSYPSAPGRAGACRVAHPFLRSGAKRRVESAARSIARDCDRSTDMRAVSVEKAQRLFSVLRRSPA